MIQRRPAWSLHKDEFTKKFIEFTKCSIKNKRRETYDLLDNLRPVVKLFIYILKCKSGDFISLNLTQ